MSSIDSELTMSGGRSIRARFIAVSSAFFGLLLTGAAHTSDFDLSVTATQTYSDNIKLEPDELARDDYVTRLSPRVGFARESESSEINVDYSYEYLFYWNDSSSDQDFHQLDSDALVDVIGDELQLLGIANYSQRNSNPQQPLEDSNVTRAGNRENVSYWQIGPQWQRVLPLDSEITAYYNYGRWQYDSARSQDVDSQRTGVNISNTSNASDSTGYELNYDFWLLDYERSGEVRNQELWLKLSEEIFFGFRLTGLAGLDSDLANPNDSSLSEGRWEVGMDSSGPDGHIMAATGKRYFGTTLRLSAGRAFADWYFTASYVEAPGTTESRPFDTDIGDVPGDDDELLPPPESGLDRPGSGQRWITNRADGSVQWTGHKSRLLLRVWRDERDNLPLFDQGIIDSGGDDFFVISTEKSVGGSLNYRWDVGSRTSADFSALLVERDVINRSLENNVIVDRPSQIDSFRIVGHIQYRLGVKTSLGATASYREDSGTNPSNNFSEIRVWVDLTRSF